MPPGSPSRSARRTPVTPAGHRPPAPSLATHSGAAQGAPHQPGPSRPAPRGLERAPGTVRTTATPLSRAVAAALRHIADLAGVDGRAAFVERGRIDQMLREVVGRLPEGSDRAGAAAAVRVACAHLVAGDTEDAYLALLTARDMLS